MIEQSLLEKLVEALRCMPGVGRKSAQRIAHYLLQRDRDGAKYLSELMADAMERIGNCKRCRNFTENEFCHICMDKKRDDSIICVVEEPQDIYVFEKTNAFHGRYHVLGGVLSPLDGIGPEDLNLQNLYKRVKAGMEIILATNPSIEGDTTSLYLAKMLENLGAKVTRLARGLPVGSDLEYMDELTVVRAMEGRTIV